MLSLDVSWWGKSRFVAYVTRGPLNYALIDVIRLIDSAAIALHVFLWIILNFPAIERPWARSLLQLPETFACVTS